MSFISAGEILGATTPVRTLTIAPVPKLPDGDYAMVESYCTDPGCDCRKTMIFVHLDRRHVSTINFGWESAKFYARWYGLPLDARTLSCMPAAEIVVGSSTGTYQRTRRRGAGRRRRDPSAARRVWLREPTRKHEQCRTPVPGRARGADH